MMQHQQQRQPQKRLQQPRQQSKGACVLVTGRSNAPNVLRLADVSSLFTLLALEKVAATPPSTDTKPGAATAPVAVKTEPKSDAASNARALAAKERARKRRLRKKRKKARKKASGPLEVDL